MKIVVKRTRPYARKVRKLLAAKDVIAMEAAIAENPLRWPVIQGTGGVRKARHAAHGRGQSGGVRVAYYLHVKGPSVYMLTVYAKKDRDNLNEADKAALKQFVKAIKAAENGD